MAKNSNDDKNLEHEGSKYVPARIEQDETLGEMLLREKVVNMAQLN